MARHRREASTQDGRAGRRARRASEIPAPGWRQILARVKDELRKDHISIIAAGIAFYAMLALFPGILTVVSVYGLIADPAQVERQLSALSGVMPEQAWGILRSQLRKVAPGGGDTLGMGFVGSLLFILWAAIASMRALMTALNIPYDQAEETRGFFRVNAVALLLSIGGLLFAFLALVLAIGAPPLIAAMGLAGIIGQVMSVLRWPLLALVMMLWLAVLYRYGPGRGAPKWRWVTWGSAAATVLWLIASGLFSIYVATFTGYGAIYGPAGAVIILLIWLYIGAYAVLLGAELNAEIEHQTAEDTTSGPARPMGNRGASVADTVGEPH